MRKGIGALVGSVVMALLIIGCATTGTTEKAKEKVRRTFSPDTAKIWYSVGKDYMKKGQYDDAIRNFKRALEYDSTFIQAYLDIGKSYIEKAKKSIEEAKTLLESGQDSLAKMAKDLAWSYLDSAEVAYRMVAKIKPTDSRGWQGLGYLYGIVKDSVDKGIQFYKKAIETDPTNYDAMFGLAKLYEHAGMNAEADSLYKSAIAGDPQNIALKRAYGLFLYEGERYKEAVPYLEEAIKKYPDDKDVRNALIDSYLKIAEEFKETNKDSFKFYSYKAIEHLDSLIVRDSLNAKLWTKRGNIHQDIGEIKKALADFDKAIQCEPDNPSYYLQKANLLLDEFKDTRRCRKVLQECLKLERSGPDVRATAYVLIGNSYYLDGVRLFKEKKYEESMNTFDLAISYYQKALAEQTTDAWRSFRSYAQKMLNNTKEKRQMAWRKYKGID